MPNKAVAAQSDGKDRRRKKGKKTVKNSSTSPREIAVTAAFKRKAEEAVQYRLQGYTFQQIGEELKVNRTYAYKLVRYAMESQPIEGVEELRSLMAARLEMMLTATLADAFEGDSERMDQARRTMEFQAKLLGLYAPQKVEHSGEVAGGAQPVFVISAADAKL
ncbi:hypothetical protein HU675_0038305 [Bradyrhizobium septentrionale]|uniref:hypothetical protein n=1 Tax=Bradyrhizobium septentrionale TaxID=1404411 RepID=UPI001596C295|nr:hypothetical protein [Bradyrhizobium septentrionale]UGY23740.1 hypothetical protein HU675_0038305 [Bradyrhizobium septentrionale]